MRTDKAIGVRVPPEVKQWLEKRASENRRSVTGEVSWILLQFKTRELKEGGQKPAP